MFMVAAATLVSCSKSEMVETGADGAQDIALKSSITKMDATTRAPFVGELSKTNSLQAVVLTSLTSGNYSSLYCTGTMTFKGSVDGVAYDRPYTGTNTFQGTDIHYLSGVYPKEFAIGSSTATMTITGKEDVMYAPEVATTRDKVQNLDFATLAFTHQLTKLETRFRADGPDAIGAFGNIKKIELIKANDADINTGASIALNTGAVTFGAPTITSLNCYGMTVGADDVVSYGDVVYAGNHLLTTDATFLAYTLAPPVNAAIATTAKEYTFRVTCNNGGADIVKTAEIDLKDVDGNLFVGPTAGYSFLVTFHFSKNEINAVATVQDWRDGGESITIFD